MAREVRRSGARKKIYACDSYVGFDRSELKAEKESGLTTARDDGIVPTSAPVSSTGPVAASAAVAAAVAVAAGAWVAISLRTRR